MAMVVKNNMSAVSTLNTLNKNSSALQKSLQKVSSGMKINSTQDDASGYAISEKMRVQIRSLDQANQNTQNASSLMKTAEGAVSSTVEILKSLKEKAINAATDTNTDADRATIQKELDQFIDQIDDNALATFNGKYLVDGSKNNAHRATYASFTNQGLTESTTGITKLAGELSNCLGESLEIESTDYVTASYVKDGKTHTTTYQVADTTVQDIFKNLNALNSNANVFGKPDVGTPTDQADSNADLIAAASDADIRKVLEKDASADSDLKAALAAKASDLASALTTAKSDFETELTGKEVASQATNTPSTTPVNGTAVVTGSNKTAITLDATQAGAVADAIVAYAADSTTTLSGDIAQTVAGAVTISPGGSASEALNATNEKFHELTRAALLDAAAKAATPVEVSDKTLASGGTESITAANSDTVVAADTVGHADTHLQTVAGDINTAMSGAAGWTDLSITATGDELIAALQTALSTDAVKTALLTSDATGVTLDKYNHQVDAAAAESLKAAGKLSTGNGTAPQTDEGLVLSDSQIGVDKNKDNVYTNDGTKGLTVSAAKSGVAEQIAGVTISISDSEGNVRKAANAALNDFKMSIRAENQTTGIGTADTNNILSFQVGAAANQSIAVNLTDMRSEALGLKGSDGSKVSVATQDKANAAVAVFDNAIQKALDQQTTLGAVESRLDYTSSNLTTMSENVQAAESTIRDADMAKK
jgi:flagellin